MKNKCLEHAVDVLAQTGGYMYGAQIVLIHLVGNELIRNLGLVEKPCCIRLIDFHNIHVVFTKTAETADHYIEKFAHENGKKYNVTVATSDGVEQVIIRGQGCLLISAREFEKEIAAMEEHLRENYLNKTY